MDNYLIIGAGSMGHRRAACLSKLNKNGFVFYDNNKFLGIGVDALTDISVYSAVFICTPPRTKQVYIDMCNKANVPCFCEADIIQYDGNYYPSRSLVYHNMVRNLKENYLGEPYAFNYHMGQYLRDWHPKADYTKYYAAQKETGAVREMLAFELAWLSSVFGVPNMINGMKAKKMNDPEITADDVAAVTVSFGASNPIVGTMLIDVLARRPIRRLTIVSEEGQIEWDFYQNRIKYIKPNCTTIADVEADYEGMYVAETRNFLEAIQGIDDYPYNKVDEQLIVNMAGSIFGYRCALKEE